MSQTFLARLQFGFTVGFHYIFPPLTIGLAWLIVYFLWRFSRGGEEIHRTAARFWTRIFAVSFVIGVATGIPMEFQFGTNWAQYARFVGDIFGAPLAIEGVFAFFLESVFLGVLLFGERRVSPRVHRFAALMVAFGATLSGFWIIVANSWQQTPTGFVLRNGRAELTSFLQAVFNPSTMPRYLHTIDGALITGAFFMMGLSARYLLRSEHVEFARMSLRASLVAGFAASVLQLPLGHVHAVQVAETQPVKLAAFEGLFQTQRGAPFLVFGIPNSRTERVDLAVPIPGMLSLLVNFNPASEVKGLKDFPRDEWPPLRSSALTFHFMVMLGMYFIALTCLGVLLLLRKRLFETRWFLKLALWSIPLPFIANELGWIAAEIGRQPWAVYGVLRTADAVSISVPASSILASLIGFFLVYCLLFVLWIYLIGQKLRQGPEPSPHGQEVHP